MSRTLTIFDESLLLLPLGVVVFGVSGDTLMIMGEGVGSCLDRSICTDGSK